MPIETHDVLIVGGGGREDALGWKLRQSERVRNIYYAAPENNAGTGRWGKNLGINPMDKNEIAKFAEFERIGLTVVGPEAPLLDGLVDLYYQRDLADKGVMIYGPTKEAAQIEGSKAWTAGFCDRHNIPHAKSAIFTKSQIRDAHQYADQNLAPLVYKADGQALGKGVLLPPTKDEEHEAIDRFLRKEEFGQAGTTIVVQERLTGPEVSVECTSDGDTVVMEKEVADHKRAYDNDEGPNTGGMGAYSPVPFVDSKLTETIKRTIMVPTIRGLSQEGCPFIGTLFGGLIISNGNPVVLEFNARRGDPETQAKLVLMKSDLFPLLYGAATGKLEGIRAHFSQDHAICVVLASGGYPDKYITGFPIQGLHQADSKKGVEIFMAGVKTDISQGHVTSGGRVLGVTATGRDMRDAFQKAYKVIEEPEGVNFYRMSYRTDIGLKAFR